MNAFSVSLYKLILYVKCLLLEEPREKLKLFTGLAECLLDNVTFPCSDEICLFNVHLLFEVTKHEKFFISHMGFITSVFMLPLEVETAPAAQQLHRAFLDLEFLRCELLPPFHRDVSAFFPLGSWLYCMHFLLVKRQGAIEDT